MYGMAELTLLLFFAFVEDTVAKGGGSSGGRSSGGRSSGGRSRSSGSRSSGSHGSDSEGETCEAGCVIVILIILGVLVLFFGGCFHSFWRSVKRIKKERFEIARAVKTTRANQSDNIKPASVPPHMVPPSGPWICEYSDASHQADVTSTCTVQFFNDGRITGTGTDPDGTYTMEGYYNYLTKRCQWTEQQTLSNLACELEGTGYSANPEVAFYQISGRYIANTGFHGPFTLLYNGQWPPATAGPQYVIPVPGHPPQASPQVVSPAGNAGYYPSPGYPPQASPQLVNPAANAGYYPPPGYPPQASPQAVNPAANAGYYPPPGYPPHAGYYPAGVGAPINGPHHGSYPPDTATSLAQPQQAALPPGAIPPDPSNVPHDLISQHSPRGMASSLPPAADSGTSQIELSKKSKWQAACAAVNAAEAFQSVTLSEYTKSKSLPSSNKRGEVEVHWEVYARLKWKLRQLLGKR